MAGFISRREHDFFRGFVLNLNLIKINIRSKNSRKRDLESGLLKIGYNGHLRENFSQNINKKEKNIFRNCSFLGELIRLSVVEISWRRKKSTGK